MFIGMPVAEKLSPRQYSNLVVAIMSYTQGAYPARGTAMRQVLSQFT